MLLHKGGKTVLWIAKLSEKIDNTRSILSLLLFFFSFSCFATLLLPSLGYVCMYCTYTYRDRPVTTDSTFQLFSFSLSQKSSG